jgi:hypothetical protein
LGKTRRLVRGDAASTIEKAGLVPIFPGSANFDPEAFLVLIVITIDNKASKSGRTPGFGLITRHEFSVAGYAVQPASVVERIEDETGRLHCRPVCAAV